MLEDMRGELVEIFAVHMQKRAAAGAFQMEMIAALAGLLDILPARGACLVNDVFAQDALVFQPLLPRNQRDSAPVLSVRKTAVVSLDRIPEA